MHWIAISVAVLLFLLLPKRMGVPIAIAALLYAGWAYRSDTGVGGSGRELASIRMTAEYSESICGKASPLRITIENGSGQRVSRVDWNVGANVPGTSSNVVSSIDISAGHYQMPFSTAYSDERLLLPGHRADICLALPPMVEGREAAELNWFVTDKRVKFPGD